MEILLGVIMAGVLGISTYLGKMTKGEVFQPYKLARTFIIGLVLGVVAYFSGYKITAENWEAYALTNAGIIGFADIAVKAGWRMLVEKK